MSSAHEPIRAAALGGLVLLTALTAAPAASPMESSRVAAAAGTPCDLAAAAPWIRRWLEAWELTSREILKLPDAEPPEIVFFDSTCVYTTSDVSVPGPAMAGGPTLFGAALPWRATAHDDSLTLPNGSRSAVQLMSFANSDRQSGPFFVMAAPSYWLRAVRAEGPGLAAVFLHEFAHTRQVRGMLKVIGPIDSTWKSRFPEELDDDAVQTHFDRDSIYVAAWRAECDLLYRAAQAKTNREARALASRALVLMRERHDRWFHGENAVFATLDDLWLSLEGAGQWAGYAWLAHPKGGRMDRAAAVERMSGRRRRWSQDQGLGLFLVVDRLLPGWPRLVFSETSIGAMELLERATGTPPRAPKPQASP